MKLWRIAAQTLTYTADDLSGKGAAKFPGRWNDSGEHAVYCAPTIAMAVLETAAHINDAGLPLNKFLVEIDVPDAVWANRTERLTSSVPVTWLAIPPGQASVQIGSKWLSDGATTILAVPSVIVPEEFVCVINPARCAVDGITAKVVRLFEYNRLFRR